MLSSSTWDSGGGEGGEGEGGGPINLSSPPPPNAVAPVVADHDRLRVFRDDGDDFDCDFESSLGILSCISRYKHGNISQASKLT